MSSLPLPNDSLLLVIDVQDRLAQAMPPKVAEGNIRRIKKLLIAARELKIPRLYSEQYPQGLGPTLPVLKAELSDAPRFEKLTFSCLDCPSLRQEILKHSRRNVVLAGIEAHVCVLQTALAIQEVGLTPWVVKDALLSRFKEDYLSALAFMQQRGIPMVTTEIIIFGWLRGADHPSFREMSRLLKERD